MISVRSMRTPNASTKSPRIVPAVRRAPNRPAYRAAVVAAVALLAGCTTPPRAPSAAAQRVAAAARPLLTLDPNAAWTEAYNELLALGPAALDYLMAQPALARPAAPDDLNVLVHTSLVRLLADPASQPPRLTATCFETTHDLLHFDLKVQGQPLGELAIPADARPRTWPELYPTGFDHARAACVDLETDRKALQVWWRTQSDHGEFALAARRLAPRLTDLWSLLARRYADRWLYQPEPRAALCARGPQEPTLLRVPTVDYNLVRAACIWLGRSDNPADRGQLIELLAHPSGIVAHNARFALTFARDERIRAALERRPPPP
jgi:hypothetical protein